MRRGAIIAAIVVVILCTTSCKSQEIPDASVSDSPGSTFTQPGQPGDTEIPTQSPSQGEDVTPKFDDVPVVDPQPAEPVTNEPVEPNPAIQTPDLTADDQNTVSIYRLSSDKTAVTTVMGEVLSEEFAALSSEEAHSRMSQLYGLQVDDHFWDVCYGENRCYTGCKDVELYLTDIDRSNETYSYLGLVHTMRQGTERTLFITCTVSATGSVGKLCTYEVY